MCMGEKKSTNEKFENHFGHLKWKKNSLSN